MILEFFERHARRVMLIGGITLLIICASWFAAARWRPDPSLFPVQGIDVSQRNGEIDWWEVRKSGAQFAYVKATEGSATVDANFAANWQNADVAEFRRGALHVFSFCTSGVEQAENFVRTVPRIEGQLPPAVELASDADCKDRPERAAVLTELRAFLSAIETHLGEHAVLRVSKRAEARYGISTATAPHLLWANSVFVEPTYLPRPWTIWQASSHRRISGVNGAVNWNVMANDRL